MNRIFLVASVLCVGVGVWIHYYHPFSFEFTIEVNKSNAHIFFGIFAGALMFVVMTLISAIIAWAPSSRR